MRKPALIKVHWDQARFSTARAQRRWSLRIFGNIGPFIGVPFSGQVARGGGPPVLPRAPPGRPGGLPPRSGAGAGRTRELRGFSRLPARRALSIGPYFNLVRADRQLDLLHDHVLRELLGIVGEGLPAQDDGPVLDRHAQLAHPSPQLLLQEGLELLRKGYRRVVLAHGYLPALSV